MPAGMEATALGSLFPKAPCSFSQHFSLSHPDSVSTCLAHLSSVRSQTWPPLEVVGTLE